MTWFSVINIVNALTDSKDPSKYWYDMKRREKDVELSAICRKFRMKASNGRHYQTECVDTEGMTRLELAFTILGEAATTEITRQENKQGFAENQTAARKGGRIAGNARRELEAETGKPIVSETNYLDKPQSEQEYLPTGEETDNEIPF